MDFFDTHSHYDWEEFDKDRNIILSKMNKNCIIVNIGCNIASCKKSIELTNLYKNIYCSLGIHPMNVETLESLKEIEKLITNKTMAIGETGLDYKFTNIELQKKYFVNHIKLANKYELPIIIHCRKAHQELYNIILKNPIKNNAIMHCFSGTLEDAKKFYNLGFYFGFDGPITRTTKYDEIIKFLPLEKIIVETDAPILPPYPLNENERCDSSHLKYIIRKIANIKEIDYDIAKEEIFKNSLKVYNILNNK